MIELLKKQRRRSPVSKTLATIRTDAPIEFKLPKKLFGERRPPKNRRSFFVVEFEVCSRRLKNFLGEKFQKESFGAGLAGVGDPENRGPGQNFAF